MYPYKDALLLIKTFEGFNEKAYPDPETGKEPYTIGYGTQFYPDGTPVKQGHYVTKEKAFEYLVNEIDIIAKQILKLNLGLNQSMLCALISFVHSIGWDAFLYSNIVDHLENEDYVEATEDMACWIFDNQHKVIGGLIDRRRNEIKLFLKEQQNFEYAFKDLLLKAFREYKASQKQIVAIRQFQECINPYALSAFMNSFFEDSYDRIYSAALSEEELQAIYQNWK